MKQLLTIDELSEKRRLSKNSLYRYTKELKIPSFRIGRHLRFDWDAVIKWLYEKRRFPKSNLRNNIDKQKR